MIEKTRPEKKASDNTAYFPNVERSTRLRLVFMGTPEFAVASLKALVESGHQIVGVVTAPDKAAGRGLQMQQSAVKKYAAEHNLHVLQPEKLKDPAFLNNLSNLNADLQIVVAFRMLPELVWAMPAMGTINLHGSLLPQYRGAAPINWAIINGETETGVTTFKLKHEIDTGDILLRERLIISPGDDAGTLHDRMKEIGARLLVKTLKGLADNSIVEQPQVMNGIFENIMHAPKIFSETCRINWARTTGEIHNLIRGLSPYPGAFTEIEGKKFKIYKASVIPADHRKLPGSVDTDQKSVLRFAANDGWIAASEVQLEGKKRLPVTEFLRGFRFPQRL